MSLGNPPEKPHPPAPPMELEMTVDPGWAYCPVCNTVSEWAADGPICSKAGLCKGKSTLPIPTTEER